MLNYLESDMQSCQCLGEFHFPKECPNLPVMLWLSCISGREGWGKCWVFWKGPGPSYFLLWDRSEIYLLCLLPKDSTPVFLFSFLLSWFKFLFAFWILFKVFLLHEIWRLKGQDKKDPSDNSRLIADLRLHIYLRY